MRVVLVAAAAVTAVAATLSGCRSSAPLIVALGPQQYGGRRYLGTLPFWEGPQEELTVGRGWISPHSLAITSTREMQGLLAELWHDGNGQIAFRADVYPGAVTALASDGQGNVVFFRRHLTPEGDLYDLEHDRLYMVDLRRPVPPRVLDVPPFNKLRGGTGTVVCGGGRGGFVAWLETSGGFEARPVAAPPGTSPSPPPPPVSKAEPRAWPPEMCAAEDDCASIMFEQGPDPPVVETRCDGRVDRQVLEDHWPSSTILHPRGTVAASNTSDRQSTVTVRRLGGPPRSFPIAGTVYGLTFWDQRTLLVHLAEGQANRPTSISVITLDAEKGPLTRTNLDFARARSDRRSLPDLVLLPSGGNGRPLLGRIDNDIVLITGTGELWTWRAQR